MSTAIDYLGRTSDYSVCTLANPGGPAQPVTLELFSARRGGELTTGVQKLLQHFMILLLTEKGSVTHDPDRGSSFLIDAKAGAWRTTESVHMSFATAAADVRRQLLGEETATDPDDERLDTATLVDVQLQFDSISLTISLTSMAGTSVQYIAPIPVMTR